MMLFPGQYVLILALLSSYAVNASIVKRDAEPEATTSTSASDPPGSGGPDTSSLQQLLESLISLVQQIPLLGSTLAELLETVVELILELELLTNGAVARLLGGALPCIVSLDNGFQCSGITENGGLIQLLENVIDSLPNLLVPVFVKNLVKTLLTSLVAPLLDVLLGGIPDIKV